MCPIFDFKCNKCEEVIEKLTGYDTFAITCGCGGMMEKQLSMPQIKLDGTDPGFPGAYDKWARTRNQDAKIQRKKSYFEG